MPNRIIKETIKTSDSIDCLSWFEEVMFYRMIVTADDYGCIDGRLVVLRNELFPTKETVKTKDIEEALRKLERLKMVHLYTVDGHPYIYLLTWEDHQRIRNKHRKFPEPTFDSDSLSSDIQETANCPSESESNPIQSNQNPNMNPNGNAKRFTPPTIEEVEDYIRENMFIVNPQKFVDYYEANGWLVGKNRMKDWKATVRNWDRREQEKFQTEQNAKKKGGLTLF